MSHEIDLTTGRAAIAYTGKMPWHGLGQQLPENTDIDQWRIAAGLNWKIQKAMPRYYTDAERVDMLEVSDKRVLLRSDTKAALSIVSNKYKVVQPGQVLEFFRDLVADGGMQLETAGALKGGRTIWALATNRKAASLGTRLDTQDIIKPYVMLATSCDCTSSTKAYFTTVRVECANMLAMSAGDARSGVAVRHNTTFNERQVKEQLGLVDTTFDAFMGDADDLASIAMSDAQATNYFAELYVKRDAKQNVTNEPAVEKTVNNLMALYKSGPGATLPSANGTAWGALNAVTRYVDHHARANSGHNRFVSGQFGPGAAKKQQARDALLAA